MRKNALTRIQLRWLYPVHQFDDLDGLGTYSFSVSRQGQTFRDNRAHSEDLFAARSFLENHGWTSCDHSCRHTIHDRGHDRHNPIEHTETWHRLAAPRAGDNHW